MLSGPNYVLSMLPGQAKQPGILSQMIADAHEIREKQSANRTHIINNVAIKGQNNADDSVNAVYSYFSCAFR